MMTCIISFFFYMLRGLFSAICCSLHQMMESEILVPAEGLKLTLQNGFHEHVSDSSEDIVPKVIVSEGINEDAGATMEQENMENSLKLSGSATNESTTRELMEGSNFPAENNISTLSKATEFISSDLLD